MVLPFSLLHLPFFLRFFSLMTSFCASSSIFSHQIHHRNRRGRYQKPLTTSHHVVAVWSIIWQERVVPIVHARLTLNLDSCRLQPLSSSNFRVDQAINFFFYILFWFVYGWFFFHIFKHFRIHCVWRLLGSIFMVIGFLGLDFMVMVGQQFNA